MKTRSNIKYFLLIALFLSSITNTAVSKTMEVVIEYDRGKINIASLSISDVKKQNSPSGEYSISILNDYYQEIYSFKFNIPLIIDVPPDPLTGESYQTRLNRGSALIRIPYLSNGRYIKIFDTITPINKILYTSSLPPPPTELIYGDCTGNRCFDLILVADGYSDDMTRFKADAEALAKFFGNTEPYKSNLDRIRITRVDNTTPLNCYNNCNGIQRLICCDSNKVFSAVSGINYDEIIVITNINDYGGSGHIDGSDCAEASSYAVIFRDINYYAKEVAIHETGHSFGGLWDEYEYGTNGVGDGPNCVHDSTCSQWKGMAGTGCYSGCSYNNMYRPTENSCLMRTLTPTGGFKFCPVCQNRIYSKLSNCFSNTCTPDCSNKECGDDGCGGNCGNCNNPPQDYCFDLQTLRDYSPYGSCVSNRCSYSYTDKKCPFICEQNRCISNKEDGGTDIVINDLITTEDTETHLDVGAHQDIQIDTITNETNDTRTLKDIAEEDLMIIKDEVTTGCNCNFIQ